MRRILLSAIFLMVVMFAVIHYDPKEYSANNEQAYINRICEMADIPFMSVAIMDNDAEIFLNYNRDEPEFKGERATITIRQLLEHTSGIPEWTICRIPSGTSENSSLRQTVDSFFRTDNFSDEITQGNKVNFLKTRSFDAPAYYGNIAAGYLVSNTSDLELECLSCLH